MSATTTLEARRGALNEREAGFTLIELLVVVIIIGILAAIAIPIYIGVQNNAKDSAVKSDLVNAKTSLVSYASERNGAFPTSVSLVGVTNDSPAVDLSKYGWSKSSNTTNLVYSVQGSGVTTTWCILGTSSTNNKFSVSTSSQVQGGASTSACPATY